MENTEASNFALEQDGGKDLTVFKEFSQQHCTDPTANEGRNNFFLVGSSTQIPVDFKHP